MFQSCLFLPIGKNRRRTAERFKSVKYNFSVRPSSLHEMSTGAQQINNAVQGGMPNLRTLKRGGKKQATTNATHIAAFPNAIGKNHLTHSQ